MTPEEIEILIQQVQGLIEQVRAETQKGGNTKERVANLLTKINDILALINENSSGGSSDLTLEQARQNGNVLEGDINIGFLDSITYIRNINNSDENRFSAIKFSDDGVVGIYSIIDEKTTEFFTGTGVYYISTDVPNALGIKANQEFDKQGERTAFAQLSDLYDNVPTKILDSNDETSKGFWTGTQAQYDAIVTKDTNTIYIIL